LNELLLFSCSLKDMLQCIGWSNRYNFGSAVRVGRFMQKYCLQSSLHDSFVALTYVVNTGEKRDS